MINQINCPICGNKSQEEPTNSNSFHIICPKCGEFFISRTLESMFQHQDNRTHNYKISSWTSEQNKVFGNIPDLLTTDLDTIINQRKKTIKKKFDCFIKNISTLNNGKIN